jgi:hypothetical protein
MSERENGGEAVAPASTVTVVTEEINSWCNSQ